MCGIVGIWEYANPKSVSDLSSLIGRMAKTIEHRGPDGSGVWSEESEGIAFGHRRLSIIDLSSTGHQPMSTNDGGCVICYNGEIYNAAEIRTELQGLGRRFRGTSDTEVILEACFVWGVEKTVKMLNGMFAFSFWDGTEKCLYLVRDRLGIKPLYYFLKPGFLAFGSELKSLVELPQISRRLCDDAVSCFFRNGYIPSEFSIYNDIKKLPPSSILRIDAKGDSNIYEYWSLEEISRSAAKGMKVSNQEDAISSLETVLQDAVSIRMVADVDLGAFLSGGVDSSLVVALMQKVSNRPVRTFSIGFSDARYNEATYAKEVASFLGTDHTELILDSDDALEVVSELPTLFDEPFADASQIPTYLLSRLTREHVTVALSGDGGDELFAGYSKYQNALRARRVRAMIPGGLRSPLATGLKSIPASFLNDVEARLGKRQKTLGNLSEKVRKLAGVLESVDNGAFAGMAAQWCDVWPLEDIPETAAEEWSDHLLTSINASYLRRMQYCDTKGYLPDDILTKVDRASMAASLEARVPLLDHRVVENALSISDDLKIRKGVTKSILREVLYKYVPRELVDRPKQGFQIPLKDWLKGPLRGLVDELILSDNVVGSNMFNTDQIRRVWSEHVEGVRNREFEIWNLIVFKLWLEKWKPTI